MHKMYLNFVAIVTLYLHAATLNHAPAAAPANPHADTVVVGITLACAILLVLILLMTRSCFCILKNGTAKKSVPVLVTS